MEIKIQLTASPISEHVPAMRPPGAGAWTEFRGVVRGEESGAEISALEYEAYPEMAEREIRRLLKDISARHPCLAVTVIHRTGAIPVGETAIYVGVAAKHRGPAYALLAEFMDRLKKDVPIWKRCAIPAQSAAPANLAGASGSPAGKSALQLADALALIRSSCAPLPGVRVPLAEAQGRVLREAVPAAEDFPSHDRSTRDGYAILRDDSSDEFTVVDTIFAADWKPRKLKPGEAVRIATGASLPAENLRVVMQEDVQRDGDKIKIIRRDNETNIRTRGSELQKGDVVLPAGRRLGPGPLSLLASAGCSQPLVSPRLRVIHFTTGDEIIPPDRKPKPGQVRDSNSILIQSLLKKYVGEGTQAHLPKDFPTARAVHFGSEVIKLAAISLPDHIISLISPEIAKKYRVIPISKIGNTITVALSDPSNLAAIDGLHHLLRTDIELKVASEQDIESALNKYYAAGGGLGDVAPQETVQGLIQVHLPEDFERAKSACEKWRAQIDTADVILVSGGASVGSSDFTAPFLAWLGFVPVFSQLNIRPGRPLIFSANGPRIAFGLPGNPLAHFVCFHIFVAAALALREGAEPPAFVHGRLADKLDEPPNPRETLWPARMQLRNCICELQPIQWNSSGDVTAFQEANALIRIPPRSNPLPAGAEVEFLPAGA